MGIYNSRKGFGESLFFRCIVEKRESPWGLPPEKIELADGQVIPLFNNGFLVVGSVSEVIVAQVQSGQFAQALGSQIGTDGTALPVDVLILLAFQTGDEVNEQLCVLFVGAALNQSNTAELALG